ncbi:hypothetical protein [Pedobacter sp. SL55]|uniref:hypothetical protein n=1 Tax=Pedobacter sp. SL55 TaxID=2995161 RepID=UPI00226EE8DB|nr:hypothetical protein [Pedobacter sp. SL55]WAC41180.1 hypothetical protein OVA16_02050 [Pedobacter sp. SL55]
MKSLILTFTFLFSFALVNAQSNIFDNKDRLSEVSHSMLISPTTIKIDPNGIPVYFAVLKVNGNVVEIYPFRIYTYKNTFDLSNYFEFNIPKSLFTAEQIVELISTYKFELKDNYLSKSIYKVFSNYDKSTPLPNYITYSIEKLTLK